MFWEIINSSIRVLIGYLMLLVFTRLMGRKMVSQITFFDFVLAIIIGSVVANMAVNFESPVISGVTSLAVLTLMTVLLQFSMLKSLFLRKLIDFESIVVIENGKINAENLKKTRLRIDNLLMMLREQNAFNVADVEFAVLETDGKLSVLKKSHKLPLTPEHMSMSTPYVGLSKDIILDGKVMYENLSDAKLDKEWLFNKLRNRNIHSISEVFYAGLDTSGNLYISLINNTEKNTNYGI
ncbi:UNVERIFIED_CONTAM: uncharacterized membrane protein YcaP (DUF421 family) [Acetivibrio alkalicellulosi]